MRRWKWTVGAILWLMPLAGVSYSADSQERVRTYLVDARIHLSVVARAGTGGEIYWVDTVTGHSGAAPYRAEGDHLVAQLAGGRHTQVHLLPGLAVVLKHPPWQTDTQGSALGVALN